MDNVCDRSRLALLVNDVQVGIVGAGIRIPAQRRVAGVLNPPNVAS